MTNSVHHRRPQTSFTGPLVKKLPKTGRYFTLNIMVRELLSIAPKPLNRDPKAKVNNASMNPFDFEIATLQNTEAKSELGSADDGHPPEIDSHLNRLLNLWNRLKSITDRASDVKSRSLARSQDFELLAIAALREAEYADLIEQSMETELTTLCGELKQKAEALQARETTLVRLEETSKAKLAELENRIQNQENQLTDRDTERQQLRSERDHLVHRSNETELAAKRPEAQVCTFSLDMAKREDCVAAKESDLHRVEADQKTDIENLQLRLQ